MPLTDAVQAVDRREALTAIRDALAADIEAVDERYRAPLYKQLTDVLREIATLPNAERKSDVDDLRKHRAKRRAAASGQ